MGFFSCFYNLSVMLILYSSLSSFIIEALFLILFRSWLSSIALGTLFMQALDAILAKQDELIAYIDKKKKKKMVCN